MKTILVILFILFLFMAVQAVFADIPEQEEIVLNRKLLLISNSSMYGEGYLEWARNISDVPGRQRGY